MPANDRVQTAREIYGAYASGDRSVVEEVLSEDFTFYTPASTARPTSSDAGRTPGTWRHSTSCG